jgi:periplasmic protein TonB
MSDKNFFYISGIISFSFYCLFFLLFVLYIKGHNIKTIDAFSKATVLELNIVVDDKPKEEKAVQTTVMKNTEKSQEEVKQSASKSLKTSSADVQSLFAKVSVDAPAKKEVVTNTEKNVVMSKFKAEVEKQTKSESSVSKLLESVKQSSSKLTISDSKNESDPYYSKVYEIIASRWNPRVDVDDLSAKVLITIYSDGRFEFTFLKYSSNDAFDEDLQNFLAGQTMVLYPPHDKGYKTSIEITFKSKE